MSNNVTLSPKIIAKNMSKKIPLGYALPAIILSILLVIIVIYTWTKPTASPPQENVPAPTPQGNVPVPTIKGGVIDTTYMDGAWSVYVSGKYAYVTGAGSNSLAIVDISNPTSPSVIGGVIDSTYMNGPTSVYVSGKYAYVTGVNSNSLAVVEISGL